MKIEEKLKQISTENFNASRVLTSYDDVQNLMSLLTCINADLKAQDFLRLNC